MATANPTLLYETNGPYAVLLRKKSGMSQADIEKGVTIGKQKIGLGKRTISKIENDGRVSANSLRIYAKCVGLLGEDDWLQLLSERQRANLHLPPIEAERPATERVDPGEMLAAEQLKLVLPGISAVVNSSEIPMYFADTKLEILVSNKSFRDLIGTEGWDIREMSISEVLHKYSILRIPENHREAMEEWQEELIESFLERRADSKGAALFNNRALKQGRFTGWYRLWISAHKVEAEPAKVPVGLFVIIHAEELDEEGFRKLERLSVEEFQEQAWKL